MGLFKIVFWICISLIAYSYFGYGLLTSLLVFVKKVLITTPEPGDREFPPLCLVVAAYNEELVIEQKIRNSLDLEYPPGRLSLLFITDGSTDKTPELIGKHADILLLHQPERLGKTAALNRAMTFVQSPVVVFSDANSFLNREALIRLASHYRDPKIGGVAGEKKILNIPGSEAAGTGEGIYWKYESWLKKMDSDLYTVVGAAGELFSIRSSLFEPLPHSTILDDFVLSLNIVEKGYRFAYESMAYAIEAPSSSLREEQKRKIRICAGGFQAMSRLKGLLHFWKHPIASFQYISHRVLRWTLVPLSLPILFLVNLFLVIQVAGSFFRLAFIVQCLFYSLSLGGYFLARRNISIKPLYIPYYFFFMNLSVFLGFWRFLRGKQSATWEKASRDILPT